MAEPSQTLRLRDGRALGWMVYGARSGRPVLGFHGAPACRLMFSPADAAASRHGMRLIVPDRPGYGLSEPMPGRSLKDWADDTAQLMDRLGIDRAPVVAISGGGPYAVATAALLGDRISGLALASPLGEVADPAARAKMTRAHRAFFLGLPRHPMMLQQSAAAGRASFLAAPEIFYATFRAMVSGPDRELLARAEPRTVIMDMTREALRTGVAGAVSDMLIYGRPWGIDLGAIRCSSVLWQGTADHIVPAGVSFLLGSRIPGCSVRRLGEQGHFWVLEHVDEVLAAVAEMLKA